MALKLALDSSDTFNQNYYPVANSDNLIITDRDEIAAHSTNYPQRDTSIATSVADEVVLLLVSFSGNNK